MDLTSTQDSRIRPELHLFLLLALFYAFTSVILAHEGHAFDQPLWAEWIIYMRQHGIRHVYDLYMHPLPGQKQVFIYGPVYMYLLYVYGKVHGSDQMVRETIYQFKSVVLIFDVIGIWLALRYLPNKANRPFYALFLIFNVGLLYDTVGWGQNDSIIACLMLIAVRCSLRGQLAISGICVLIAFLIKPQPIIFLPALGLLWLPYVIQRSVGRLFIDFLAIVLVGVLLLAPFLMAGTARDYWTMLQHTMSMHPSVSIYAANIWVWLLAEDPYKVSDLIVRYGLTYRQWGLLMFTMGYGVVLFPLVRQTYWLLKGKIAHFDIATVLLTFGLIPIVFYFFNTQIHERYAHFSLLFLAAYALHKGDFVPYLIASMANFWVIEKGLFIVRLYGLYDLITLDLLALLFLLVLVWGIVKLYGMYLAEKYGESNRLSRGVLS